MTSQDTTSNSPSSSEPSPPADGPGDPASRSRQPSPPRSLRRPRRRATHEPSAFRSFVVATRFRADADRCRTRANSIRFRPDRDDDEDYDAFASVAGDGGRMGDMDSGSLARYDNCSNVCFGDRQLASSLFQVANRGGDDDDADDRLRGGDEGAGLEHWREASLVAMSFDTAEKAANTLSRYRERTRSFDGGVLPSAQDPEPRRGDDEESGLFIDSSDQRRPAAGLTAPEMPPEDERSGVFSQQSAGVESATSSVLWNHIDQSYHSHRRNRRSTAPPASCREGKRLRKSAMHVARRVARGVAGLLVLAALLLYIAFEVDLESIEENLMERFSDNDNPGDNEEEAVAPSHLRYRKLPQEQVPVKNLAPVPREDQVVASLPKQRARERRESLRRASLQ